MKDYRTEIELCLVVQGYSEYVFQYHFYKYGKSAGYMIAHARMRELWKILREIEEK